MAVGVVGIAFGVLARSAGLSVAQTCAMSLLVFTGASQLAAVGIVAGGGSIVTAIGSALLLGARNALYGPAVAPWFGSRSTSTRLGVAHLVIDESTGLGASQPDANEEPFARARTGFLAAGLAVYVFWNLGTLIGALTGDLLGDISRWGLDAAFPAAFAALLAPHLRRREGQVTAAIAFVIVAVAIPLLPAGVPVLIAALAIVPGAWIRLRPSAAS